MATQDRLPTGIGFINYWTATAGANKWEDVDDPIGTPDDDTSYISHATSFQEQLFAFTAFAITSSAIASVTVSAVCREVSSADANDISLGLRVNGTYYNGSNKSLTTSYATYTTTWLTNPNTGSSWIEADVEGTGANPLQEFGISTRSVTVEKRCTQIYITVDYTEAGGGLSIPVAMNQYRQRWA